MQAQEEVQDERVLMTGDEQMNQPPVQSMETTIKALKIQHKAMSQLVGMHLETLLSVMVSSNGVTQKKKLQAAAALIEAFQFSLDFGLGITKTKIHDKGEPYATQANNLAAVLVKAQDNRMVLLADQMAKQEALEAEQQLNADELLADVELETNSEETQSE